MKYVKLTNGVPSEYSLNRLRVENPNVSFPSTPSEASLVEYNVYPLVDGDKPAFDIVTPGSIEEINGVWTQTYTGRNYTAEEIRVGMVVSMRQARLALSQAGKLELVDSSIASMPEPDKTTVSIEWQYASTVERLSPWVLAMIPALGMTEYEMDSLFQIAETL